VTLSRLTFLVALYITLDLTNPMMPGALGFSSDDSVEVQLFRAPRLHDVATLSARASERPEPIVEDPVPSFPVVNAPRTCSAHVTRSCLPSPARAASSEDD